MGFFAAIKSCYAKTFTFSGRAPRSEYWWFMLFQMLLGVVFWGAFLAGMTAFPQILELAKQGVTPPGGFLPYISALFVLQFLLFVMPGLSVLVRRLHDTDRSGWWYFISFVPLIGGIWLLVLMCLPGSEGRNTHGPDPLGPRRRLSTHPALMGDLDPEIKAALRERQQADFKAYYKSRVLPQIQQNKAARGV
jgi:uncharacterized membrane protein YhaH (DUF805 family)